MKNGKYRFGLLRAWLPLILAAVTFLVYWPSLRSGFVYDARQIVFVEGFVTSFSHIWDVLTLKVLGMNLMLGDRPGQLLLLILEAAVWGKNPWGYHLASNLLHAANVALLFVLLRRLVTGEFLHPTESGRLKIDMAISAATLIIALHPIAVEPVSAVSYSSDLLVTFFTLTALIAGTFFSPGAVRTSLVAGISGTLFAFAAVACKESGIAASLALVAYWFLFRRTEPKRPWFLFLGVVVAASAAFLAAHFILNPAGPVSSKYIGGSLSRVLVVQPRLWVFMMGKLIWPTGLSADYLLQDIDAPGTLIALAILAIVLSLQTWLATRSRLGALGVAIYWLGLATVSNFFPLYRILADRFYYLPLAGVALQLLAVLLLIAPSRAGFRFALTGCFVALLPLTLLTLRREQVFASDFSLWSDTLRVSPHSDNAENGLGVILYENGQLDEAVKHLQRALLLNPHLNTAYNNLGCIYFQKGQVADAIRALENAVAADPNYASAHFNLGIALSENGQVDEALEHFRRLLEFDPNYPDLNFNYGVALAQKGRYDDAIAQYRRALEIDPKSVAAYINLGTVFYQRGEPDQAMVQFQTALGINPRSSEAHYNLGYCLVQKGHVDDAIPQFEQAIELNPNYVAAQINLGCALLSKGRAGEAIPHLQIALKLAPADPKARDNLARAQATLRHH